MKQTFFSIALFFLTLLGTAQIGPFKYFIEFNDKNGPPYSVNNPQEFLTQRAIDRRASQFIPVTEQDLPVNPSYVAQVANTGVTVITQTKWFNGITIYTQDTTKLAVISAFPFVKQILKNSYPEGQQLLTEDKFKIESSFISANLSKNQNKTLPLGYDYGPSYRQIHMVKGDLLHNMGYRGQGKVIAILDAGFAQVDILKAFDSLWHNNQILGTRDFVSPGSNVFTSHYHGMTVLSVLAGNYPGLIIGTAPKASYWLLRSEDASTTTSEYLIEEYNWVSAAEFADSVGADIISSSLGYTTFTDPRQNHSCADMDGNTTPVTRGANIAALKGMVVVSSAGNTGGSSWYCVSAPADGDNVLAIGAVDSLGNYASFSATGIDTNGRVKPNIAAMGEHSVVFWFNDSIVRGSGTSYSCPLIAGMIACLWQSHPETTPARIYQAIEESASHYSNPDSLTGYGIPDFNLALTVLSTPEKSISPAEVFPNPFTNEFTLSYFSSSAQKAKIYIYDIMGHLIYSSSIDLRVGENKMKFMDMKQLSQGLYMLKIMGQYFTESLHLIKSEK